MNHELHTYFLGFFLCLGFLNVIENLQSTLRRRFNPIYTLALLASICQFLVILCFAIQDSVRPSDDGSCAIIATAQTIFYYVFQIFATGVTFYRATTVVNERWILPCRIGMGVLLAGSIAVNIVSGRRKVVFLGEDGTCKTIFDRRLIDISHIILLVLYILILVCFLNPFVQHITKVARTGISSRRIRKVVLSVAGKLVLVIIAQLLVSSLSLAKIFGTDFHIQFTIEGYCFIVASTWSCAPKFVDTDKQDTPWEAMWSMGGNNALAKQAQEIAATNPHGEQNV